VSRLEYIGDRLLAAYGAFDGCGARCATGVIEELIAGRKIQAIKAKYAVEELERRLDAGS